MGKLGSYSCKLTDLKPKTTLNKFKLKKVHVPLMNAQDLIFAVLRNNRAAIQRAQFLYCALSYVETKRINRALKGYIV